MSLSYSYLEKRAYLALGIFVAIWAYFIFWQFHLTSDPNVYPQYAANPPMRTCTILALQFICLSMFVIGFPVMCIESVSTKTYGLISKIFSNRNVFFMCLAIIATMMFWIITTGGGTHDIQIEKLFHDMFGYMIVIPTITSLIFGITVYAILRSKRTRIY